MTPETETPRMMSARRLLDTRSGLSTAGILPRSLPKPFARSSFHAQGHAICGRCSAPTRGGWVNASHPGCKRLLHRAMSRPDNPTHAMRRKATVAVLNRLKARIDYFDLAGQTDSQSARSNRLALRKSIAGNRGRL